MRFIHTADWHLGRQFHNFSLIEDQRHVLEQLVALAREAEADAFVIAGDVFDRAVPGPEAVALLDECLAELVLHLGIPVIMIAGNHDSGRRLSFAARLLARAGLYVFGQYDGPPRFVVLADRFGPVHFVGMPFAEPALVREASGESELQNHAQAMAWLSRVAREAIPAAERSVCVAHCFVAGGEESESERPLSVGGAAAVPRDCFAGFSYTALGHLHRPQAIGRRIHYAGSLLKYSFSEIPHRKSANLVTLDAAGLPGIERLPLVPRRDVRLVEGELATLLKGPAPGDDPEDFLLVRLTDARELLEPMARLREVYPNVLHIERPTLSQPGADALRAHHHDGGDRELFAAFFEQVTGAPLTAAQDAAFMEAYDALLHQDREAQQ
ncbi:MAG TPA: exonuclease SbcCD subunit D [Gammaproteobacteria bacterium]|nr:exonuclease SbcCD subunit D [Gammaproteobacteria bacterium]